MGDKKRQRSTDWVRERSLEALMKKTKKDSPKEKKTEEDKNVD